MCDESLRIVRCHAWNQGDDVLSHADVLVVFVLQNELAGGLVELDHELGESVLSIVIMYHLRSGKQASDGEQTAQDGIDRATFLQSRSGLFKDSAIRLGGVLLSKADNVKARDQQHGRPFSDHNLIRHQP